MKKILTLLLVLVLCVSVFAACKKEEPQPEQPTYDVAAAAEYVEGLYKEELGTTAADFNVVPQVRVAGATYTITWTVDTDKVTVEVSEDGKTVTVNVPEKSDEDFSYSLTATVKAPDGTTASTSFTCNVIKYAVNSHADYMAAQKDDELTIEGIVVAINSVSMGNKYNHLFLADAEVDGGYYCYKLSADPAELGIKVGMTVSITSKASPYNGMQELFGGTPVIVDETIKTVDVLDITDAFTAKSNLGAYVGLPVTIKGVTLGEQALEKDTDQYLWFAIGDAKGYVRTYVTDFPAGMLAADDKAAIDANHKDHFGWKADVTGILILYSGQPYLIPMSVTPFTNYEEQIKTPEEKVAAELAGVKLDASLSSDKVIDLLLAGQYYDDVVLTWTTTDETGAAVIADGKLTLTVPDEAITVSITVTATCGEVSDSKNLTIKLSKTITSLKDAAEIAGAKDHNTFTEEKYIVGGIILEIATGDYGNMTIKDEEGNTLYIYGSFIGGEKYGLATCDKPVVGDYVVLVGVLGRYNTTLQMKNGDITYFVTPSSIKDAADAGAAQDHNTYTENKFLVTGVIESIANTQYGNLTIKDAEGNSIYVYGLYSQPGVRYDALTVKPAVGDTITILGAAGRYNETVQIKNATLVAHTVASTEPPVEECEHNYVDGVCTKCEAVDPDYVPGGSTTPDEPNPPAGNENEIVFDFGANGDAAHVDGTEIIGSKNFTSGNYTLALTNVSKVYDGAFDAKGNSALKFGTSSLAGTMTFVVPDEVTSVIIYVAKYKSYADNNLIEINGVQYAANGGSNEGEYDAITIDTTTVKTLVVASAKTSGKARIMINSIVWVIGEGGDAPVVPPVEEECEHNYVDGVCTKCEAVDPDYVAPAPDEPTSGVVSAPVAGTAYKFGMVQSNLNDGKIYYLAGGMSSYYMATTTDVAQAIDVYLEVVDGGFYLYTLSGETKTYINMVVSGTHVNGAYEATASTVYRFDATSKTLIADVNGTDYWFGTRNDKNYTTVGPCAVSYKGFICQFYGETAGEDNPPAPECEHTYVEGVCTKCEAVDPDYVAPAPECEHNYVDGVCTKCEAVDPDYVAPNPPATTTGGSADFNTIAPPTSTSPGYGQYDKSFTTANGWTTVNAALQCGGGTTNPQFMCIGDSSDIKAICLNGKTSAIGKLTSPTLEGGVSKITFKYTKVFTDLKLGVTIKVTDLATGEVYTHVVERDVEKDADKGVIWTDEWVLETPITGNFTIEVINNCPSASTSNKDRITILDLSWEA